MGNVGENIGKTVDLGEPNNFKQCINSVWKCTECKEIHTFKIFCRVFPGEEVLSVLIHSFVYANIHKYKKSKQPIGPITFSVLQQQNFIERINSKSLTGFGINFLLHFTLFSMAVTATKINQTNPKELGDYPNYFFIYYYQLFAPGALGILFIILVFHRNPSLKKAFQESMKDIYLNFREKFVY
jgi:hypothetical protein